MFQLCLTVLPESFPVCPVISSLRAILPDELRFFSIISSSERHFSFLVHVTKQFVFFSHLVELGSNLPRDFDLSSVNVRYNDCHTWYMVLIRRSSAIYVGEPSVFIPSRG